MPTVAVITDAPPSYDWFNPKWINAGRLLNKASSFHPDVDGDGYPMLRLVWIDEERVNAQRARYSSGLFYSTTLSDIAAHGDEWEEALPSMLDLNPNTKEAIAIHMRFHNP